MSAEPMVKKPCVLIEQECQAPVIRSWWSFTAFDDTDGLRLPRLRKMVFELRAETEPHKGISARPYRLYDNCGITEEMLPSYGGQWHGDIDSAFDRATMVAEAYAYTRQRQIEAYHQAQFMERWRNRTRALDLTTGDEGR